MTDLLQKSTDRLRAVIESSNRDVYGVNGELYRQDLARVLNAVAPIQLPLTSKQRAILDFIRTRIEQDGYSPTFDVIGEAFGFKSLASVAEHLTNLERKGWIRRAYNCKSGVSLVGVAT